MNELISIIVPVYNCEKYLKQCLDSIINQKYSNLEIILVDDGSQDGSPLICDEYAAADRRIKVIHKKNGGVSSARNAGIQEAVGKYVLFVDSDDYIDSNMCSLLVASISDYDISICGYYVLVNSSRVMNNFKSKNYINLMDFAVDFKQLLDRYYFHSCFNKLFRRELIQTMFDVTLDMGEDLIFNLNYLMRCQRICVIEDCLYYYRKSSDTLTTKYRENIFDIEKILYRSLDNYCRYYIKNNSRKIVASSFVKNTCYIVQSFVRLLPYDQCMAKIRSIIDDDLFQGIIQDITILDIRYCFIILSARRKNYKAIFKFFKFKQGLAKLFGNKGKCLP